MKIVYSHLHHVTAVAMKEQLALFGSFLADYGRKLDASKGDPYPEVSVGSELSRILGTNEGWPVSRILRHTVTGCHHHHQAGQAGKVLQSTPISGRPEYSSCLASLRTVVVVVVVVPRNSVT